MLTGILQEAFNTGPYLTVAWFVVALTAVVSVTVFLHNTLTLDRVVNASRYRGSFPSSFPVEGDFYRVPAPMDLLVLTVKIDRLVLITLAFVALLPLSAQGLSDNPYHSLVGFTVRFLDLWVVAAGSLYLTAPRLLHRYRLGLLREFLTVGRKPKYYDTFGMDNHLAFVKIEVATHVARTTEGGRRSKITELGDWGRDSVYQVSGGKCFVLCVRNGYVDIFDTNGF